VLRRQSVRPGSTLAELLVALALTAIVLGAASASVLRQQRISSTLTGTVASESQAQAAAMILSSGLAGLAPSAGDLSPGGARDSSLQLRAAILTGFACDDAAGRAIIGAAGRGDTAGAAALSLPRTGDSIWWYLGKGAAWIGRSVAQVASGAYCASTATGGAARVAFVGADTVPRGAPVRITRQTRYVVYRAGDGSWQVGLREWNEGAQQFSAPEPLAGPFQRRLPSGERTGFRYFDAGGQELTAGAELDVGRIARLRITVLGAARNGASGASGDGIRRDSLDVAVQGAPAP
jgi:hypothetical protein